MELSVLTFNVWYEQVAKRWPAQVIAIRKLKPDIICLQEVQSLDVANHFCKEFSAEYKCARFEGRLSLGTMFVLGIAWLLLYAFWAFCQQLGIIDQRPILGGLLSVLCLLLILWRDPAQATGFLLGNRTGLLLFVRKEKMLSTRLSATLFREWQYDYLNWVRPRGFLTVDAELQVGQSKIPLKVMSSHLDQPIQQVEGRGRVRQAEEMLEQIKQFQGLALLAGDLNCTKSNVPGGTSCGTYELIRKHMKDACEVNKDPTSSEIKQCFTWDQVENPLARSTMNDLAYGSSSPLRQQVDYVFWQHQGPIGNISCSSCQVVFNEDGNLLSDHYGMLAKFRVAA
eukprot:TRINITY_DN97329_c0_g1_i1.p1 TRINITY_DN97329_c0_g1~~TRINITY_DN97329_c0_g1_i1.p1  ORF type:complete len:340 (-),score=48.47 TRINITY_DN97329_c0_g1_i1:55-1074(-)